MIGTIIGDIAGSRFEFNNHRSTDFNLFGNGCSYTDDTIMTLAVADAIMKKRNFEDVMREYGKRYPTPMGSYGARFSAWLNSPRPEPYDSFGNGAAMRVSPCAYLARGSRLYALRLAASSAVCSHNHPEGIKGAMAVTDAILLAQQHQPKESIRTRITELYGYDLSFTCDDIRETNTFNETCQVTVPQALVAFLDSYDFESAIRLAVSIGGDSDTIACITGGIAEAYYGVPERLKEAALGMLPEHLKIVALNMYAYAKR